MNTLLRQAQKEMAQLNRKNEESETTTLDFVLMFDRTEEEMEQLVGYHDFMRAMQELGGQRTEENIQRACEVSGLNRRSVWNEDSRQQEDIHIPIKCKRTEAKKLLQRNGYFGHTNIYLD